MKSILNVVRKNLLPVSAIAMAAILFSACNKFDDNEQTQTPVAGLMSFNLAPDKASIGLALSGSSLTNVPLAYTSYTGVYQRIFPGNRTVDAYDNNGSSPFASTSYTFMPDKYYSSFTVGNAGNYKNIVVEDGLDSLSSTAADAYVRYINAIPDSTTSPSVQLTNAGSTSTETPAYTTVSDFKPVTAGELTIAVSNESNVSTSRTITIEKGKVYTLLLIGLPGSTNPEQAVQVKYIVNGTLTP